MFVSVTILLKIANPKIILCPDSIRDGCISSFRPDIRNRFYSLIMNGESAAMKSLIEIISKLRYHINVMSNSILNELIKPKFLLLIF